MADNAFADPRVAALYDPLDADRGDLDVYVAIVAEFGAASVVDLGCGTGTFACLLAQQGKEVVAADPSGAMIAVARGKRHADLVRWLVGDAKSLPQLQVDVLTMTGNVAQVFLTDEEWDATLRAANAALRPGGRLVFEIRDPAKKSWREWNRDQSFVRVTIPGLGVVETWEDLIDVCLPLVTFRSTIRFESTGETVVSQSTLRFRTKDEVSSSLQDAGFTIEEIRDAPDRPGREFVFIARTAAQRPVQLAATYADSAMLWCARPGPGRPRFGLREIERGELVTRKV
jgi:ubiquinone/menaquinone biosynthesis C-methylase UbiE